MTSARHTLAILVTNPADRRLLVNTLCAVGYGATDRLPGLDAGNAPAVSLVIADEVMGEKWHRTLSELRRQSPNKFIPALVLLPLRADSAHWLANGFNDALRMPLTKAELLSRVQAFIELKERS